LAKKKIIEFHKQAFASSKPIVNPVVNFILPSNSCDDNQGKEAVKETVIKDFIATERQKALLSSSVDIAIWGPGLRMCGNTWGLMLEALRHVKNKNHHAIIFRRAYPSLINAGGLIMTSEAIFLWFGGKLENHVWKFSSGAEIVLECLHTENDAQSWIGSSLPVICFDQLEDFSETQFMSMLETNHWQNGGKGYIRATAFNFRHDNWLLDFLSWWTMGGNQPLADRIGIVRWMAVVSGKIVWADSESELRNKYAGVTPRSVTLLA
jgi:hypothetical protein